MNTTLNRTDLTAYETEVLHATKNKVAEHSLAVGAFMTRYGSEDVLQEAANLFLELVQQLDADANLRTAALVYGMEMAEFAANDRHASQAYQLRSRFLNYLYSAAAADRKDFAA